MRIVTFSVHGDSRLGLFTDKGVVDLSRACSRYSDAGLSALFSDARTFLNGGEFAVKLAKEFALGTRRTTRGRRARPRTPGPSSRATR